MPPRTRDSEPPAVECPDSEVRRHLPDASPRLAVGGELASTPGTSQLAAERQPRRCGPLCACELTNQDTSLIGRCPSFQKSRRSAAIWHLTSKDGRLKRWRS